MAHTLDVVSLLAPTHPTHLLLPTFLHVPLDAHHASHQQLASALHLLRRTPLALFRASRFAPGLLCMPIQKLDYVRPGAGLRMYVRVNPFATDIQTPTLQAAQAAQAAQVHNGAP